MTIDFDLDADQRQVVAAVQDVLADRFPLARFRGRGAGADDGAMAEMAALGWLGLGVAEADGGAGFTLVEEVLLFRELGRHLVTPAVLAGSLAAQTALALGQRDLAAGFLDGSLRACLAQALPGTGPTHVLLDGIDAGHAATWAATWAVTWGSAGIACIPAGSIAMIARGQCIDRTVALHHAELPDEGWLVVPGDRLCRRADLLVAAQLLGLAEGALDLAVDYAKLRRQFGQPIGAFQAIKHRCADMKLRARLLAAAVMMAALAERDGRDDAALQVAAARLLAGRYAVENAAAGIQIHGGIGFTAECDAHLYLLRAHLLDGLGAAAAEREHQVATL